MADYNPDINTVLYKYRQPLYVTEPTGNQQTFVPLKLNLTEYNFNFDLAKDDGLDFRLAERSNGTGVFQMWVAYWDITQRKGTLYFKLPVIEGGETRILYAFWGYAYDTGVSDVDSLTYGYDKEYTANLCVGGTASAYAINGFRSGDADDVFDNNLNTYIWPMDYSGADAWIKYDFGAGNEQQIERLEIYQYDCKDVIIQGSNDDSFWNDLGLQRFNDMPGGTVPDIQEWTIWAFENNTAYRYYRFLIRNAWGTAFIIGEMEMKAVASITQNDSGIFLFADDFDGSTLDTDKWPTSNGSYTINNSRIDLGIDAWIRTGNVLGGANTAYIGTPYQLPRSAGLYGDHQHTGNCYLGYYGGLSYTNNALIDGVINAEVTYGNVSSQGGCAIGVDLGSVRNKISKLRFYIYNHTNSFNGQLDWEGPSYPSWANVYKTDTNVDGDQVSVYSYTETEMTIHKAATDYTWYIDLPFDAPGQETRYFHMFGRFSFSPTISYTFSEIEVYADESSANILPGKFIVEEGIIGTGNPTSTSVAAHRYRFYGGDNVMGINYFWEGATDRTHDFLYAGTYSTYNGVNKGLIANEYAQLYIGYYEGTDRVYQGMANRGGEQTAVYSEDLCTDPSSTIAFAWAPGWGPELAINDSTSSWWLDNTTGVDGDTWWGYEFVSATNISRVTIHFYYAQYYYIQGSNDPEADWDNKTWTEIVYSGAGSPDFTNAYVQHDFDEEASFKYFRVFIVGGGSPGIYNIEMFTLLYYDSEFDYDDSWERKVHRNTEVSNFRIYGEDTSAGNGVAIDWVIAREFDPAKTLGIDYRSLYVEHEYVGHQPLDFSEYQGDVTAVDFYHISDMGGDPYRMSDDVTNSITNVFRSGVGVTEGSIVIDFGRTNDNVVFSNYTHFNDPETVLYYNANKLSDRDTDVHGRDYWQSTTTSGWAAIEFPTTKDISCLAFKAVPGLTSGAPDNFRFYGSNSNPRFQGWNDKVLLYEGQGRDTEQEQVFYFSTGLTYYKYYILEVLDTHGTTIALQEWAMYERTSVTGKKVVAQLRLHPVAFENNEYYFAKEVELYGSNDGFTWDLLLTRTPTPTPFTDYAYGRWSRYTIDNFTGYYLYKLTCYDNWRAELDQIMMAEWEMVERVEELDTYRILEGTSNINNIWADPTTTVDSGTIYITNENFNTVENEKLLQSVLMETETGGGYWAQTGDFTDRTYGGVATSNLGTYNGDAQYVPAKAFDDSLSTYWHSVAYSSYPVWIQYEFTEVQNITSLRMYPRPDQTSRMPGDFILKASNTGLFAGEETDILSVTGATYSNGQWTEFNFTNGTEFLYYRVHITNKAAGSGSGNYMNIFEIEMKGYPAPVWVPEHSTVSVDDFNVKL